MNVEREPVCKQIVKWSHTTIEKAQEDEGENVTSSNLCPRFIVGSLEKQCSNENAKDLRDGD